jgi:hypothetical protein
VSNIQPGRAGWLIAGAEKWTVSPIIIDRWLEAGRSPTPGKRRTISRTFFQTGVTKTNTIGVSGGAGAVTYRASVSDMHNKGIIPNTKLERQTVNLRLSADVSSNLSIDGKINYVRQRATNRPQINSYSQNPMTALNLLPRFMSLERLKDYKKGRRDDDTRQWFAEPILDCE